MPALLPGHKKNFETLRRAVKNGDAALMDCRLRETGESVAVICAVNSGGDYEFIPLARLFDDDPYQLLDPPDSGGGYASPDAVSH
jgi:hypothetical protein